MVNPFLQCSPHAVEAVYLGAELGLAWGEAEAMPSSPEAPVRLGSPLSTGAGSPWVSTFT
eukprot:5254774-Pyramimonas_sp.AAC.1